ncbi:IS701 family transposase [Chondrinema litorale]|uniref:IS701 family transposase n=1 Tax=Chondrinema litorale TaxID=2994555 RepID=UPI00254313A7|nr:transposase [Chondrinema litorale]UZR99738.1 transposase [Chondrinema litorale]
MNKSLYISYLLHTHGNYTCTHMAAHSMDVSHDQVTRFLAHSKFTSSDLWDIVKGHLQDSPDSFILVDDSVQAKRYSRYIELAKRQYSGNEHGLVNGINLVNMVHSNGIDGDYYPIDYRIYHPETDKKTKNDHFQEMFTRMTMRKDLKAKKILFDSWYASMDNLKLVHRSGWTFFTTLKSNRQVSLSRDTGMQAVGTVELSGRQLLEGVQVKLKKYPYPVKLFKIVSLNGDIEWVITNDLSDRMNVFEAENESQIRWQIEQFHREYKQLTGSEKCQCRKAISQRNHLACCYQAWIGLKLLAKQLKTTLYQIKVLPFSNYLKQILANPIIIFNLNA